MLKKIKKELERFRKRLFYSGKKHKQIEQMRYELENLPYEIYDKVAKKDFSLQLPKIKTVDETLDKILEYKYSLSRFGDGEFSIMNDGRINFQDRSPALASRLQEVITSNVPNLLIAVPPAAFLNLALATIPEWICCWRQQALQRGSRWRGKEGSRV